MVFPLVHHMNHESYCMSLSSPVTRRLCGNFSVIISDYADNSVPDRWAVVDQLCRHQRKGATVWTVSGLSSATPSSIYWHKDHLLWWKMKNGNIWLSPVLSSPCRHVTVRNVTHKYVFTLKTHPGVNTGAIAFSLPQVGNTVSCHTVCLMEAARRFVMWS